MVGVLWRSLVWLALVRMLIAVVGWRNEELKRGEDGRVSGNALTPRPIDGSSVEM